MDFQDLAEVHATGDAQRVQDDVNRGSILKEWHVLDRENPGDHTLVSVTSSELVALGDFALLSDIDDNPLVHTGAEFVVTIDSVKDLDADDGALLAVGNLERRIANFTALLVEDCSQQPLFSAELGFTLGCDLAHEDVARANLCTDTNDASLIQVGQELGADIRKVTSDLFLTQLGVAGVHVILLDVNRGQSVVLDQVLGEDDCVFEVVALP
ncbi:unannotated protein [freshwater metagenome]|uniref:Unannotated protein n=1 Tax=freshwater metagenome TaxID=449393 RepID=A0A6J6KNN4_9ZZZZ